MDGINNLKYDNFIEKFGNVVEHCPIIAAVVWAARPFPSFADLFDRFSTVIDSLSMESKDRPLSLSDNNSKINTETSHCHCH